jgi:hypothetical protein
MANQVRLIVAASSPQSGSGPGPTIYRTGDGGETWAVFRDTATIGPDILNSFPES